MNDENNNVLDFSDWLSPKQAALKLNLTPDRVRGWCREGKLKYVITQNGRLIDPESVEQHLKNPTSRRTKKPYK